MMDGNLCRGSHLVSFLCARSAPQECLGPPGTLHGCSGCLARGGEAPGGVDTHNERPDTASGWCLTEEAQRQASNIRPAHDVAFQAQQAERDSPCKVAGRHAALVGAYKVSPRRRVCVSVGAFTGEPLCY